jgi:hypothetical protein
MRAVTIPSPAPKPVHERVLVLRCQRGHFNTPDSGAVGRPPTVLRGNVHLILNLILTVINWVEGVLKSTYVESVSGASQNQLKVRVKQVLYH